LAEGRASALRWLYHWSDENRPALATVSDAENEANRLREKIIKERWRKFWPRLTLSILLPILLLAGLVYGSYERPKPQQSGPSLPLVNVNNNSHELAEKPSNKSNEIFEEKPSEIAEIAKEDGLISKEVHHETETRPQTGNQTTRRETYTEKRTYKIPGGQRTETTIITTETQLGRTDVSDTNAVATIEKKREPTKGLSGIITEDDGTPIKGAKVFFEETTGLKPVESADNGVFSINNIPTGFGEVFRINVLKDGYQSELTAIFTGGMRTIRLKKKR